MKHEKVTEEIQEMATLYALGALSQHEARAFESHLREPCAVCEAELLQYQNTVAGIGLAAPAATPPSYLRDLLSARIERETQAPALTPAEVVAVETKRPSTQSPPGRAILPWAIAACIAILALIPFQAWRQAQQEINDQQERITAARSEAERLQAALDQEREKLKELEQIRSALSGPDSRAILLAGQDPALPSSAQIYWDTQNNRWVVRANLPPAPTGKVYQLWYVTAEAKISAGLIRTDQTGRAFLIIELPPGIGKAAAAAITLEPEGGSSQPTMPIYALGKV